MSTQRKTIVVSNRLPLTIESENATPHCLLTSDGGLISTLESIMWNSGGIWVGCAPAEDVVALTVDGIEWSKRLGYSTAPVGLDFEERVDHEGFSSDAIWPLFHCSKSHCKIEPECWNTYCSVNGKVAKAVELVAGLEDCIWVHDYPLMMVASLLRANGSHHRLAYSQYIPFPPPEIFKNHIRIHDVFDWSRAFHSGLESSSASRKFQRMP